jgi:predicted metal-dependent hydrolase
MTKRWGSLSKKGMLSLNVDLVRAPKESVTYVVVHELCHLKYHNHGKEFYRLLQKTMPDWARRKERLGKMAAETSLPSA